MGENMSSVLMMKDIFAKLGAQVNVQEDCKDVLRKKREVLGDALTRPTQELARLHTDQDVRHVVQCARNDLAKVGQALIDLENAIPCPLDYYRYLDVWRIFLQNIVEVCCLIQFIENDVLVDVDHVLDMIDAKNARLPLEEYLVGVCDAITELARVCMNRVTMEDYDFPKRCARFCAAVFGAFKMLNLRNDFLRKRYDGLKYDIKSIEEIMYDLSIRGLVSENVQLKKRKLDQEDGERGRENKIVNTR